MISRNCAKRLFGTASSLRDPTTSMKPGGPKSERIVEAFGLPAGVSPAPDICSQFRSPGDTSPCFRRRPKFRFLVLSQKLYDVIPDPFAIVARFPPQWDSPPLVPLEWPEQPLPPRTVEQLDSIFKNGDGPFFIGACQTLVDGGTIISLAG